MKDELVESNETTDVYRTALGLITVWKKDGKDKNGVSGKEGTSVMAYDTPPVKMKLKRKYRG